MSLLMLATRTASVKRASIASGKRGAPATVLTGLQCTPPYPADPGAVANLLQRLGINTPYRMFETYVLGEQPIQAGDTLEVDEDGAYQVRAVASWTANRPSTRAFTHLTVEEIPSS